MLQCCYRTPILFFCAGRNFHIEISREAIRNFESFQDLIIIIITIVNVINVIIVFVFLFLCEGCKKNCFVFLVLLFKKYQDYSNSVRYLKYPKLFQTINLTITLS